MNIVHPEHASSRNARRAARNQVMSQMLCANLLPRSSAGIPILSPPLPFEMSTSNPKASHSVSCQSIIAEDHSQPASRLKLMQNTYTRILLGFWMSFVLHSFHQVWLNNQRLSIDMPMNKKHMNIHKQRLCEMAATSFLGELAVTIRYPMKASKLS